MKINVIGAGAWGTAVANLLCENGNEVTLYSHENDAIESINKFHENKIYLESYNLCENLVAKNINEYNSECDLLINAVPTQYIRHYYVKHNIKCNSNLLNISKGIENSTNFLIHELFELILNLPQNNYAVLSGPSHAEETVNHLPTTVVIASKNQELKLQLQDLFNNSYSGLSFNVSVELFCLIDIDFLYSINSSGVNCIDVSFLIEFNITFSSSIFSISFDSLLFILSIFIYRSFLVDASTLN